MHVHTIGNNVSAVALALTVWGWAAFMAVSVLGTIAGTLLVEQKKGHRNE